MESKQIKQIFTVHGGMNQDDHPAFLPEGDYVDAVNVRTHGNNINDFNVSDHIDRTVGYFQTGEQNSIRPYFGQVEIVNRWYSNINGTPPEIDPPVNSTTRGVLQGNGLYSSGIFVFRTYYDGLLADYVLRISYSFGNNDYLLYNLSGSIAGIFGGGPNSRFFTSIAQIGDYLYFIGGNLTQYKVPIKGVPQQIQLSAGGDYPPLRLIKIKPAYAPKISTPDAPTLYDQKPSQTEQHLADSIQFACAFRHYDNTITPLSQFSQNVPLLQATEYVLYYDNGFSDPTLSYEYQNGVIGIIFYYRTSDIGIWYEIQEIPVTLSYQPICSFTSNQSGGNPLPTAKQNKYFESIPYTSKTLETVNGRIFLGNNLVSKSPISILNLNNLTPLTSGSQQFTYSPSGFPITSAEKTLTVKAGGLYNFGVFALDQYDRPTPITKIGSIQIPREAPIQIYGSDIDDSNINQLEGFKDALINKASQYAYYIQGSLPKDNLTIPSDCTRIGFAVTKCLNISYFLTGFGAWMYYYVPNDFIYKDDGTGHTTDNASNRIDPYDGRVLSWFSGSDLSNAQLRGIAVAYNGGEGYVWQAGDRLCVKIAYLSGEPAYNINYKWDFEIIAQVGSILFLENASIQNWFRLYAQPDNVEDQYKFWRGIQYEIYRPTLDVSNADIYYSIPDSIQAIPYTGYIEFTWYGDTTILPFTYISTSTTDIINKVSFKSGYSMYIDRRPADNVWVVNNEILPGTRGIFLKECTTWSTNRPYDTSWQNIGLGWANEVIKLNNDLPTYSGTHICFSNTKIIATNVDGSGNFDSADYYIYPYECGDITKLIRVSDNQITSVGSLLMAICWNETISIYINRNTLLDLSGRNQVALSDMVLGSFNVLLGGYGTNDPATVVRVNNNVYFFDSYQFVVVRYGLNGLTPISDVKMSTFFQKLKTQYISQIDNREFYAGYVAGFDNTNNEYYLAMNNGNDVLVWNETANRWVQRLDLSPAYIEHFGNYGYTNRFGVFQGGIERSFSDFDNTQTFFPFARPKVVFMINKYPDILKRLDHAWVASGWQQSETEPQIDITAALPYDYFRYQFNSPATVNVVPRQTPTRDRTKVSFQKLTDDMVNSGTFAGEITDPSSYTQGQKNLLFFYAMLTVYLGLNQTNIHLVKAQFNNVSDTANIGE
jgi:hypothetical protein